MDAMAPKHTGSVHSKGGGRREEGGMEERRDGGTEGRREGYLETRQALTRGNHGLTYSCQLHIVISNLSQLHFLSPQSLVY